MEAMKPWPLGGYAPGRYMCICCICKEQFTDADKRAVQFLPCAVIAAKQTIAGFREALSPSAETKAAYWGEFHFDTEESDGMGGTVTNNNTVPWTTIKEIMEAIRVRAEAAVPAYNPA
jgi:hypothetical protein